MPLLAQRRGQAIVEFAIICFILFAFLTAILSFGTQLFQANVLQQAVDTATIETSRYPAAPEAKFGELLQETTHNKYRQQIFDPAFLVVGSAEIGGQSFADFVDNNMPLLNRLLAPAMVRDDTYAPAGSNFSIRYPGAVVTYTTPAGGTDETVLVPILSTAAAAGGPRDLTWRFPVEEMTATNGSGTYGPFNVVPSAIDTGNTAPPDAFVSGLAALRVNFPYQSATAIALQFRDAGGNTIRPADVGQGTIASTDPIFADETINADPLPRNFTNDPNLDDVNFALAAGGAELGPFSGEYGLGRFVGFGASQVRPFRQVMTFQAIRSREVFSQ